ncbi:DUF6752 domain-containing protein [Blastococcus sp. SYSU DS0973]
MAAQSTLKRLVRTPAKRLRRAFVPEYEALLAEVGQLRARVAELEGRTAQLPELDGRTRLVEEGLHEARRLNLRVAQLTDVVTELVLPLHDRDIDPAVFDSLSEDTQ